MKKNYMPFQLFVLLNLFQNTGYKQGKPGMLEVYVVPVEDILSQPEPPSTSTIIGGTKTATGPWTFNEETDGFIKLNNNLFKGSRLKFGTEGELDNPSFSTTLAGKVDGLDAEIVERFDQLAGKPCVLVVKDNTCPTNKYWVVGCKCGHAYVKWTHDSDEVGGNTGKKTDFEFTAKCLPYLWKQEANPLILSTNTQASS